MAVTAGKTQELLDPELEQELLDQANKQTPAAYTYILVGGLFGGISGSIVGHILDAIFANYKDVVCDVPGHEDGGTHHGDPDWTHDGPTYEVHESSADGWWFGGSALGGMVLGVMIALAIMVYQRSQASKPEQTTPSPSAGGWFSSIFGKCATPSTGTTNTISGNNGPQA